MRSHEQAQSAITYLKGRGLTGAVAKRFAIGFAPPGWDHLLRAEGGDSTQQAVLEKAGMVVRKDEQRCYDRFRDRIMFPIRDLRGRVIAFGGRVLGDDTPKYLNSPETPVFNKSRELYGLYEARQANRKLERLIVVEGYMDTVALAQHGISYAVATLGTAVGRPHLERIFRCAPSVTFCFDGDRAGRSAASRALEATMPLMVDGRQATFLFLDEGEDPDSLVRQIGQQRFEALLDQAQPIADFLFESLGRGIDLASFDGRARLSKLTLPLIKEAPEGVFKQLLIQELARLTGLDLGAMEDLLRESSPPPGAPEAIEAPTQQAAPQGEAPEPKRPALEHQRDQGRIEKTPIRAALANLLFHPQLASLAGNLDDFEHPATLEGELLLEMLQLLQREPETPTASLLGSWLNTEKHDCATRLLGFEDLLENAEKSQREFVDAIAKLRSEREQNRIEGELQALQALLSGPEGLTEAQKAHYLELLKALHATRH